MDISSKQRMVTLPTIIAAIILAAIYLYFFAFKAYLQIDIENLENRRSWLKIYWAAENEPFSESRMVETLIRADRSHYALRIGSLGNIERLRIDPAEYRTGFRIKQLAISQQGFSDHIATGANLLDGLEAAQQIEIAERSEQGLSFKTTGGDGQLSYRIDNQTGRYIPISHIIAVLGIVLATLYLGTIVGTLQNKLAYVPILLMLAVSLTFIMAMVSKHYELKSDGTPGKYIHPDEHAHVAAVEYYRHHLLPPAVDSPLIKDSFSVYGASRLTYYELYYPITGYLSRLLVPLKQPAMTDIRFIGVLYFLFLAIFAWRRESFRPLALPLLISPQVWYLYSYTNSDGFAIMFCTLAAWQAVNKRSALNRLVSEERPRWYWFNTLWLGLLIGTLFMLKENFYVFLLFLGLYLIWRIANGDFVNRKRLWTRLGTVFLIAMSCYGVRYGLDYAVNGPDRTQKIAEVAEIQASRIYKVSTPLNDKHPHLQIRERGVNLSQLFNKLSWGGKTFYNSFGSYGFTQYFAEKSYFDLIRIIGLALIGVITCSILIRAPNAIHWLLAISIVCITITIAISVWASWARAFQPQGRYLAPILPILGVLYYHSQQWIYPRIFNALVVTMFAFSVYSFVFFGLGLIPKTP